MPARNEDLHGNVPDKSDVALLLIDVINDLEWEGGDSLLPHALPMAKRIAELKQRAKALNIPVIYVNDNFGQWRSDVKVLIDHCRQDEVRGKPLVELLKPDEDDYFVLKPKHSAFFSTTLDILLEYIQAKTLILTGVAGNICVLFTANDAYMRDFHIFAPSDCCASNRVEDNEHALQLIEQVLKGDIRPSTELDLQQVQRDAAAQRETENPLPQAQHFAKQGTR